MAGTGVPLRPERVFHFAGIRIYAAQRLLGQHQPLLPSILESLCPTPKRREIHPQPRPPSDKGALAAT